jgi:hypothetical protein
VMADSRPCRDVGLSPLSVAPEHHARFAARVPQKRNRPAQGWPN